MKVEINHSKAFLQGKYLSRAMRRELNLLALLRDGPIS